MRKKILSAVVGITMLGSVCTGFTAMADTVGANTPQYKTTARLMEELNRGLVAVKTTKDTREQTVDGVYLSWRLLGDESLENQAFDIYKNGTKIHTTGVHDATNWTDTAGKTTDKYKVVKANEDAANEPEVTPNPNNYYAKPNEVGNGNSHKNSFTYEDIPIERPDPVERMGDGKLSYYYNVDKDHDGGANDASVGDIDGDGDYEIILKWDPTDSKDSAGADFTGNVYIDAYEIDPSNKAENNDNGHLYKWRIDLGKNVTAGAHYTQFIVYDFDGDGKAEMACKTAPGSIDGTGKYVSEVGDTEEIRNVDNTKQFIGTSGRLKGKNPFTQYLTVFDGETGAALWTTEYIPYEAANDKYWGDGSAKYNRSERYLAGVAYLDGVHPSIIMCRGYYHDAIVRAYNWDGVELTMLWEHNGAKKGATSLYGQGNHQLSIADVDNDGKDEIVYGSATLDDNGVAMGNTYLGHGDALHVSDFNNDGVQEAFSVKEDGEGFKHYAEDLRVAATGKHFWSDGKIVTTGDNGRGVMDNIDDAYAQTHPNALALGWSSGLSMAHDFNGDDVAAKPAPAGSGSFDNSLVYWDGDLGRELLDANIIQKYDAANGWTKRFYGPDGGYTLTGGSTNNYTKRNASLSADLWGDWREEIIMPTGKGKDDTPALRIFTSTMPTEYRLTTLMHDSQYRCAIAWQNVGYNQPPHTSYYIGSVALATDENGNKLNYLAPETEYTKVTYQLASVPVNGVELSESEVTVEKGKTVSVSAVISPADATKKGIIWTSDDRSVATVANGVIKGVSSGTTTITATTRDGGFTAQCTVNVFSNPVTGVRVSDKLIELGIGNSKTVKAYVEPENASDSTVTWTSEDPSVADVTADGVVTGVNFGKTNVIATAADGTHSAKCLVKVKPMEITDVSGSDAFVSDTNTDDFSGTPTGAALTLNESSNAVSEFHKDFEVLTENKANLKFGFVTGGQKIGGAWDWKGHEYTLNMKFLDENGNNILTLSQPYKALTSGSTGAGTLTSKISDEEEKSFGSDWTSVIDGLGNIQGSAKTWLVNIELDYDNDTATATVTGTDGSYTAENGKYTKTFSLNGASFKTLRVEAVKDGTGTVIASPRLSNLEYTVTKTVTGTSELLYERGTDTIPWSEADLTDWVQTGTDTAALALDSGAGRIWYNPTKPAAAYSATKTIEGVSDNATLTYDVDWYFGNATNRFVNYEYLQLGSKFRLGWTSKAGTYVVLVSTDGGATYDGHSGEDVEGAVDTTKALVSEKTGTPMTKNIKLVVDTGTKTIKSFSFGGVEIEAYKNYQLPDDTTFDAVTAGFARGGGTENWEYPNGIDKIRVSQFAVGEEEPDFTEVVIDGVDGNTVNYTYSVVDADAPAEAVIIGAMYDEDGNFVEMKTNDISELKKDEFVQGSLTFNNDPDGNDIKLFMWDGLSGLNPITDVTEISLITE